MISLLVFIILLLSSYCRGGNPSTGIFVRDVLESNSTIIRQAGRRTLVPPPNNLNATFIEFPSFPRISIQRYNIATRGNHDPVLEFELDGTDEEEDTTRIGNTGLYFNLKPQSDTDADGPSDNVQTGVAKLGSVANYSIFQVPGLGEGYNGTVFDVFPGSPSIDDESKIGFKGNYAKNNESQTGVFYRQLVQEEQGGVGDIFVVANSETKIPEPTANCQNFTFGSTAPPSIANGKMVFLGLDIEENPMCGGIYEAPMDSTNFPNLTTLVDLETMVPGEENTTFSRIGEVLSYDGNAVAFWGAWGDEMETVSLCCPQTGNKDRRNFCLNVDNNTICNNSTAPGGCDSGCYQTKSVPVDQGIFVYYGGSIKTVAKGSKNNGEDFVFWTYSGKPPSAGRPDANETEAAEPPRWRSSATAALSQYNSIVYKLKVHDTVGIYWGDGVNSVQAVIETGQNCTILDADGIDSSGASLLIESLAIERDGFRGNRLAIAAACASDVVIEEGADEEDEGDWGGIYLTKICSPSSE